MRLKKKSDPGKAGRVKESSDKVLHHDYKPTKFEMVKNDVEGSND